MKIAAEMNKNHEDDLALHFDRPHDKRVNPRSKVQKKLHDFFQTGHENERTDIKYSVKP